jgi:hypothetical protein
MTTLRFSALQPTVQAKPRSSTLEVQDTVVCHHVDLSGAVFALRASVAASATEGIETDYGGGDGDGCWLCMYFPSAI